MKIASWPGYGFNANPFMEIFLDGLAEAGAEIISCDSVDALIAADVDVVILHWAETILWHSPDRWQMLANFQRLKRYFASQPPARPKLVWLAHNISPHKPPRRLQRLLWPGYMQALGRGVDGVLTLSPGTVDVVRAALPDLAQTPIDYAWHPRYPAAPITAAEARAALGLPEGGHVFGQCGHVHRYKGIDVTVAAFKQTENPNYRLYLAGKPTDPDVVAEIEQTARNDPRIITNFGDLSAEAYETALMACDTIVAPFRSYLHSGSLVHALSLGRRVLTPATPFADSLADLMGADCVSTYGTALRPDMLEAHADLAHGAVPDLSALEPIAVARQVISFLERL